MISTLNNAQLTLLELLAEPLSEKDLEQLRSMLIQFRYKRLQSLLNAQWDTNSWTQETMNTWYGEHLRTSYSPQLRS